MIYTKKQAYAEIVKLVNTFKTSEIRLNNEGEAQIENNFIRPLFKYLNWNTENDGLAIPDYEFVVQRTNRYGKRPDYVLQLDGQHLLVIDAKQVKLDMHDPRWMNQVYAYAYSTQSLAPSRKIDFAILTDFQEFVVLDCTLYAGNPKAVAKFKVLDWRYNDYVTQFDTLWELFERANMRQAACTRGTDAPEGLWARALSPKKVKANRIPPDKAFLMEMDDDKTGWRVRLAKDMKKHNPAADGALITAAVQLLIDRLIFVKALSDREIEDDYLSQLAETVERDGLAESDTGWLTACRAIFTKLNEFYNGSIFEPRPELEAVTVSNKVVRAIIHDLQPENSSYNFAVLPVEILGTIYERFLGRVVRTTDKQVKIEDKPEVRKAGGVYYTPQYIVNYIVQNTVGKLLEQCRTPEDVAKLKILDPACGSGSFLLGAYNALIGWHISYYSDKARLTKRDRAAVYYDSDGRVRLTAKLKRQILLNNLYGVDIDRQAVEVTRFSLSLKALEDIRQGEVHEERNLFKQTVLPDLSQNIKCGNSLIGPDYFTDQMFSDTDELKRVNPFDWKREFPQGDFDAVIGNPPYIRMETFKEIKDYLKAHYVCHDERSDIYAYIIERAHKVLKTGGLFGMIVSNKFLRANYGKPLRDFIQKNASVNRIVDFAGLPVFKGATVRTIVFLSSHEKQKVTLLYTPPLPIDVFANVETGLYTIETAATKTTYEVSSTALAKDVWSFATQDADALLNRLEKETTPLAEYCNGLICRGVVSGLTEAFVIDAETRTNILKANPKAAEIIKPFLNGRDIRRYALEPKDIYLIYTYHGVKISSYPAIENHLKPFKEQLKERATKQGWYELQQPQYAYVKHFESPKIVFPDIATTPRFVLDENGFYGSNTMYFIPGRDLFLLGLLNSKLADFYFRTVCAGLEGKNETYLRFFGQYLEGFPVTKSDDKARHGKMVQLVESMLALHKHKATAKTQADQELYQRQIEATNREIDALVYELYGLTPEEVKIVEGKS